MINSSAARRGIAVALRCLAARIAIAVLRRCGDAIEAMGRGGPGATIAP